MTIDEYILKLMNDKKILVSTLAYKSKVSESLIYKIRTGVKKPSKLVLYKLAKGFSELGYSLNNILIGFQNITNSSFTISEYNIANENITHNKLDILSEIKIIQENVEELKELAKNINNNIEKYNFELIQLAKLLEGVKWR